MNVMDVLSKVQVFNINILMAINIYNFTGTINQKCVLETQHIY